MLHKNFQFADILVKSDADDEYFNFEGYASTFNNEDFGGDVVMPGAFKRTLKERPKVKLLWQHDTKEIIGGFTDLVEDKKGLYVKGIMPKAHPDAVKCYALLKGGFIDSLSIGYNIKESTMDGDVRQLRDLDLHEISLVTFPMNDKAVITTVKSLEKITMEQLQGCSTKRELENFLRDSELFSNQVAITLASWFPETKQSDSVEEKQLLELVARASNLAKKQLK